MSIRREEEAAGVGRHCRDGKTPQMSCRNSERRRPGCGRGKQCNQVNGTPLVKVYDSAGGRSNGVEMDACLQSSGTGNSKRKEAEVVMWTNIKEEWDTIKIDLGTVHMQATKQPLKEYVQVSYGEELLHITSCCSFPQNSKTPINLISERKRNVHRQIFGNNHLGNVRWRPAIENVVALDQRKRIARDNIRQWQIRVSRWYSISSNKTQMAVAPPSTMAEAFLFFHRKTSAAAQNNQQSFFNSY
ncbi:hypothetical protein MUK42_17418 [Musa troglodytarum]|uniref:Uncharacterized protein n=1 Tax=Musa troglodytarum TaxID=320322 RepID=A0A9E7H814_9LILI|nr:hypothetical protein MUK42_17418 [Musa troglodytarum]